MKFGKYIFMCVVLS